MQEFLEFNLAKLKYLIKSCLLTGELEVVKQAAKNLVKLSYISLVSHLRMLHYLSTVSTF